MYRKYAGAKRAKTSISGRESCFTMKRSSMQRQGECNPPRRLGMRYVPKVFMKSTFDLPPAASHLKQRARLSTNCAPHPHC